MAASLPVNAGAPGFALAGTTAARFAAAIARLQIRLRVAQSVLERADHVLVRIDQVDRLGVRPAMGTNLLDDRACSLVERNTAEVGADARNRDHLELVAIGGD